MLQLSDRCWRAKIGWTATDPLWIKRALFWCIRWPNIGPCSIVAQVGLDSQAEVEFGAVSWQSSLGAGRRNHSRILRLTAPVRTLPVRPTPGSHLVRDGLVFPRRGSRYPD